MLRIWSGALSVSGLLAAFLLIQIQGCSSAGETAQDPSPFEPISVPTGWIDDFSYEEDLPSYLKRHAELASDHGKRPLIYLFSDRSRSCRAARSQMNYGRLATLFNDKYVIMINHQYFTQAIEEEISGPTPGAPASLPIDEKGNLVNPAFTEPRWLIPGPPVPADDRYTMLSRYFRSISDKW